MKIAIKWLTRIVIALGSIIVGAFMCQVIWIIAQIAILFIGFWNTYGH